MRGSVDLQKDLLQNVLGPRVLSDQTVGHVVQAVEVGLEELAERLGFPPSYSIQHTSIRATHRRSP
jgi:hypothetical protein